jgi:spermidine synthase
MTRDKWSGRFSLSLHLISFLSGSLALVYEVLWMRRFAVVFGATTPAAATTLAAFFLGIAAGSLVLGRRAQRWIRPLRVYGLLEFGIAAGAFITDGTLRLYDLEYRTLYGALTGSPVLLLAAKAALVTAAIFIPTFLMGGTLPALAQAFAGDLGRLGIKAGGLYAANTAGATAGALAVPLILLPMFGADWSYRLAVAGSILLGGIAWTLGRASVTPAAEIGLRKPVRKQTWPPAAVTISAFLSGFLILGLEVLWTRMFALVHENSVYSFSSVLALFLAGLAAGAALAGKLLQRGYRAWSTLGLAWIAAGLWIVVSPRLFHALSAGMDYSGYTSASGFPTLWMAIPIILPAAVAAGTIVPLLMELAGGEAGTHAGPALGRLLAVNTAGSISGPLFAGFVLSPLVGLWWAVAATGIAMVGAGAAGFRNWPRRPGRAWRPMAAWGAAGLLLWLAGPSGLPRVTIRAENGERILSLKEGSYGTVAVVDDGEHRRLVLNNHYILGGTASSGDERMQAHLPLLLHPAPRNVAFLGLGTGITAGAALLHPVTSVLALEIVPEVIDASREYFAESNSNLAGDPRVEVRAEDARNFLKGAGRKFDVIIGDLVVPWRPGESSLFSLEHFRATQEALRPGGIFCQWLPMFQLSEATFRLVTATFLQVYPKATLWRGDFLAGAPAVALIGQRNPAPLDIAAIDRRVQDLAGRVQESNPYLADRAGLWLFLMGPLDSTDPRYAGSRSNNDSRPWLELARPGTARQESVSPARFEEALFEEVRNLPFAGSSLERLDAEHLKWRDAGGELWRASMLAAQGKESAAQARAFEILATLPVPLQNAVLGKSAQ